MLDVRARGEHKRWFDFIVECKRLFLRNIYSDIDLQKMKIDDIEKYYEMFDKLVELFPVVEGALEDGDTSVVFEGFMIDELDSVYSIVRRVKRND